MEQFKPLFLNETGEKIIAALNGIKAAINNSSTGDNDDTDQSTIWSITIDRDSSDPALKPMSGNTAAWERYKAKIGRYSMTSDGKATKLDKNDSSKFAATKETDNTDNNVMVRIPKFYYHVVESENLITVEFSEVEIEGWKLSDEQWVGAYVAVYSGSNKIMSKAGVSPALTSSSHTPSSFWNLAQSNGADWGLMSYKNWKTISMIYLCEYLNRDSQISLGRGITGLTGTNGTTNFFDLSKYSKTGQTVSLGDNCGTVQESTTTSYDSTSAHVNLFGIEDIYGWVWQTLQGAYSYQNSIYTYDGNKVPSVWNSAPSGEYKEYAKYTNTEYTKAYIKDIEAGEDFDIIATSFSTDANGSSSYYADEYSATTNNNSTAKICRVGGGANNATICGIFTQSFDAPYNTTATNIGTRIAYHGNAEIVD